MALDESQIEDKKQYDRESIITSVPEYAEEIYAHLREAEVFAWIFPKFTKCDFVIISVEQLKYRKCD